MKDRIDWEKAVMYRGDQTRWKRVLKRAGNKEALTIGFLGGSITQGSLSSEPETCYAYRVFSWWKEQFPETPFTYLNAGIGGTTSQFGAARVDEDLLQYAPDAVVVDFSVNDDSNEHFLETYEGLIRRIYTSKTAPAILLLHNVYYHNGASAQLQHMRVGRHYGIPCISMLSLFCEELLSGHIAKEEITPDDLHPNDAGHALVAGAVTCFLSRVMEETDLKDESFCGEQAEWSLPAPLTKNSYEHSRRYRNDNCRPACSGFAADVRCQKDITDCFKKGWSARHKGDSICFELEGSSVAVQYRRYVQGPAPTALAVVDGDQEHGVLLDAAFDETWGDKLELVTLAEHMEYGKHMVEIVLIDAHEEDTVPFYLVSVIAAG